MGKLALGTTNTTFDMLLLPFIFSLSVGNGDAYKALTSGVILTKDNREANKHACYATSLAVRSDIYII